MVIEMNDNFNVGNRIHDLRIKRGLSQEQLALRAEITPSYLGQIERNIKNPTVKIVEKICDSLGVSLGDFFNNSHNTDGIDPLSLQILAQFSNYEDKEKRMLLTIIKDILNFKRL